MVEHEGVQGVGADVAFGAAVGFTAGADGVVVAGVVVAVGGGFRRDAGLVDQRRTADASPTPLTPTRTLKRLVDGALTDPDRPVLCSHLGDTPPGGARRRWHRRRVRHRTKDWATPNATVA